MKSAVLFLIFNRPDTTRQVFEAIRIAQPPRLYIAADGPRKERAGEAECCEVTRRIATDVDWPCEVITLFREENLGCKIAVSSAITWFFEQEEKGIILEDDCLPAQSFFGFCDELLIKYESDQRIMMISGHNKQTNWKKEDNDYFFSNLGGIWGWASWRRAWSTYDIEMKNINNFISQNGFFNLLMDIGATRRRDMEKVNSNNINAWDYQWGFARHINNGLSCVPSSNLIENIGFGIDATHTTQINNTIIKRSDIRLPLKDNIFIVPDRDYDSLFIGKTSILKKIIIRTYKMVHQ